MGCDFTSFFFKKGKVKLFQRLEANADHVKALRSLTSKEVDIPAVTAFVCSLYGFNTSNINEARYKAFMHISGGSESKPLTKIKKIDCASLPPCTKTLDNHIKRASCVAIIWKRADQTDPTGEERPTDCGWRLNHDCFDPDWYSGSKVPGSLTCPHKGDEGNMNATSTDDEESDNPWSEDSDESDTVNM